MKMTKYNPRRCCMCGNIIDHYRKEFEVCPSCDAYYDQRMEDYQNERMEAYYNDPIRQHQEAFGLSDQEMFLLFGTDSKTQYEMMRESDLYRDAVNHFPHIF